MYALACKLDKLTEPQKVAKFLVKIGPVGVKIFWTLFPEVDEETLEGVKMQDVFNKFNTHCAPMKNVPMESHIFHSMKQKEGESVAEFVTSLRQQAKKCEFLCECKKSYAEREIRDQLITGVSDGRLRVRLLDKKEATLESALNTCQSYEAAREDVKRMEKQTVAVVAAEQENDAEVYAVKKQLGQRKCYSCGFVPFTMDHKDKCPMKEIVCYGCKEKGHIRSKCRKNLPATVTSRRVRAVQQPGMVKIHQIRANKWIRKYWVNGQIVNFKIDSGAEVNCIPIRFVKKGIRRSSIRLFDYNNKPIKTAGEAKLNCKDSKTGDIYRAQFIVVSDELEPIVGLQSAVEFGLIKSADINSINANEKEQFLSVNNEVFNGLGKLPGRVKIQLEEGASPKKHYNKRFPLTVQEKLKTELERLEKDGIICEITEPTEWINNLQVVEKSNGKIRLCLDPRPLNECIRREHFIIPTLETLTSNLAGKSVFSVLDLTSGFWHLELEPESAKLTTFMTPFGRYFWKRLPFGLSCAPEMFQRKMVEIFGDISGVTVYFDDVLISGDTEDDHDMAMQEVIKRAWKNNIKFNPEKIQYKEHKVIFMGQVISKEGMEINGKYSDPIAEMKVPTDKAGVSRFLGMLRYISRYIPNMTAMTSSLRELMRKDTAFMWEKRHNDEYEVLKRVVASKQVLINFDPKIDIVIQTDASKDGLGCTLVQEGRPVGFASRTLSKSEQKWSQIEKELLAIVFACQRFHYYLYGRKFLVESDHKPLEVLIRRDIDEVPIRLQRMMMFLLKYPMMSIEYKAGKDMLIADFLSRAQVQDIEEIPELQAVIHTLTRRVCVNKENFDTYRRALAGDEEYSRICGFVEKGWPGFHKLNKCGQQFYKIKSELHYENGLLLWGDRLIVPLALQQKILVWLHNSHLGIEKTLGRAKQLYFWPGMTTQVRKIVEECRVCEKFPRNNQKEPLKLDELPRYPYHIVGMDIFEWKGSEFLSILDSYSNFLVVTPLTRKVSGSIIEKLVGLFTLIGFPSIIRADNSPFSSAEFKRFGEEYNVEFRFSSPRYPQSNGLAEKGVAIAKNIVKRCVESGRRDKLQANVLAYNLSPVASLGFAPAQLFFGRMVKSDLPVVEDTLKRCFVAEEIVENKIKERRGKQKSYFDRSSKPLDSLNVGEQVMFKKEENVWLKGVINAAVNDRSYNVKDYSGNIYRRNRSMIKKLKLQDAAIVKIQNSSDVMDELCVESEGEVNSEGDGNDSLNVPLQSTSRAESLSGDEYHSAQEEDGGARIYSRAGREIRRPAYLNDYDNEYV